MAASANDSSWSRVKKQLHILVEQGIRRMKTFCMLECEYRISMLPDLEDIWSITDALRNLKDPVFKDWNYNKIQNKRKKS